MKKEYVVTGFRGSDRSHSGYPFEERVSDYVQNQLGEPDGIERQLRRTQEFCGELAEILINAGLLSPEDLLTCCSGYGHKIEPAPAQTDAAS